MSNVPGSADESKREGRHHLALCFEPDGTVNFYPATDDPGALAARFAKLVHFLAENPTAIHCAAGHHEDGHGGR